MTDLCLETTNLSKYFRNTTGLVRRESSIVKAVDEVSLSIEKGKTLGLVGETGCGKTTLARLILRVTEPTAGKVFLNGREITSLRQNQLVTMRREVQMIFQDPYSSLNPRMKIGDIVGEPLSIHLGLAGKEQRERVMELLEMVGLSTSYADRFPHQFSGGQRQRISIARAIGMNPSLLVLDEPTSALDVSVQAQILTLLKQLQEKFKITFLFISHNLGVVKHMSDDIAVMYSGKLVEVCRADELFRKPLHPYTQALLAAIPVPVRARPRIVLESADEEEPILAQLVSGCSYNPHCRFAMEMCRHDEPELIQHVTGHLVSCHLYREGSG